MFAVLALALFVAVALVVDGGRRLNAVRDARHLADNAARIGAQEIDETRWRAEGLPIVDQSRAAAAVAQYEAHPTNAGRLDRMTVILPPPGDLDAAQRVEVEVVIRAVDGIFFDTGPVVARASAEGATGVDS
jgi:hypothetical protein